MAGRCAGLCCSFQHSLVYGAECLLLSRWTLFMHCVLWLSQLSSALCWRLLMWVWSRASRVGVHSQEWSTVGRSKMERHEQYVWMVGGGETHVVAQEDFT